MSSLFNFCIQEEGVRKGEWICKTLGWMKGIWKQSVTPAFNSITHSPFSSLLFFVCLPLPSLLLVAAILLHGCPDGGLRCGGRLLLWNTTGRQVVADFLYSWVLQALMPNTVLSPPPPNFFPNTILSLESLSDKKTLL